MLTFLPLEEPSRYYDLDYIVLDEEGRELSKMQVERRGYEAVSYVEINPDGPLSPQVSNERFLDYFGPRRLWRSQMYEDSGRAEDL